MNISLYNPETEAYSNISVSLQKVYETFYEALSVNNRYFLSLLPFVKEVRLITDINNNVIKCKLVFNASEPLIVMPDNLELYSKLFKELHDAEINQ